MPNDTKLVAMHITFFLLHNFKSNNLYMDPPCYSLAPRVGVKAAVSLAAMTAGSCNKAINQLAVYDKNYQTFPTV